MTSIDIAGATTMKSWMVDLLFARPEQSKVDPPTAAATADSAVAMASAAKSAVAPFTGQAIAALQAGGADAASDPQYTTVAQANAVEASNNTMTSAQISAALYSGKGLTDPDDGLTRETFSSMLQMERNSAQVYLNMANDPAMVAATGIQPDQWRASAARVYAVSDSMQKAYDNHTLVIQKMSNVPGLNFDERVVYLGDSDRRPSGAMWTGGFDRQAMNDLMTQLNKDGKHANSPTIGGVVLLATWTDDELKYDG